VQLFVRCNGNLAVIDGEWRKFAVGVVEIDAATAVQMIDLAGPMRRGSA
jgi:hypothetical protein